MKNIIVYGLGAVGKKMAEKLYEKEKELDIHIVALIDKVINEFQGKRNVLKPSDLQNLEFDYILVTSEKWYDEIRSELAENYGIPLQKIILLDALLSECEGQDYYCNVCGRSVPFMLRQGVGSVAFAKNKIVGGGVRSAAQCPYCNSIDRHRWISYILEKKHRYIRVKM